MKLPPFALCDQVAVVTLRGEKDKNPEPEAVRIAFPGGDLEVTRTTAGAYWVHVRVDRPGRGLFTPGVTVPGVIVSGRIDAHGQGVRDLPVGPEDYHLAVLVEREAEQPAAGRQSAGEGVA